MLILYNTPIKTNDQHLTQLIKVIVLQKLMFITRPTSNVTRIPPEQEITWPLLDSLLHRKQAKKWCL